MVLSPAVTLFAPITGTPISRMLVVAADAADTVVTIPSLLDDDGGGGASVGLPKFVNAAC